MEDKQLLNFTPSTSENNEVKGKQLFDGEAVQKHLERVIHDYLDHIPGEFNMSTVENLKKIDEKEIKKLLATIKKEAYSNSTVLMLSGMRSKLVPRSRNASADQRSPGWWPSYNGK